MTKQPIITNYSGYYTNVSTPPADALATAGRLDLPLYLHVIDGLGTPSASQISVTVVPARGVTLGPSGSYRVITGGSKKTVYIDNGWVFLMVY